MCDAVLVHRSLAILVLLIARNAEAQEPASDPSGAAAPVTSSPAPSADRTLAGHTYLFPALQNSAFVTTHFGIRQGFVIVNVPRVPLGAEKLDLNASGLSENADLGVKIVPWLGLFGTLSGQITTGTDVPSIILTGGAFAVGGDLGLAIRTFRNESTGTQGTLRLSGGLGTGRDVSILGLVGAMIATPEGTTRDVVTGSAGKYVLVPKGSRRGIASFHLAQTLTRHLGVQASLGGTYRHDTAEPFDPRENETVAIHATSVAGNAAIALSVDGAPSHFPIAAMLEYSAVLELHRDRGEEQPLGHLAGAGLYYSGTPDLQLGVAAVTQLGAPPVDGIDEAGNAAPSGAPRTYAGQFILRHVW